MLGVGDPFLNGDDMSSMMVAKNHIVGIEVLYPSNGWLIARNHLKGVESFLADIWLTEATAENTVICRCRADLVIDDGVDNEIVHCTLAPPEESDVSL